MPYISNKKYRKILDEIIKKNNHVLTEKGCLNYFLFKFAKANCKDYGDYRNLEGEVQQALREIYRRQTAKYEDKKIKINGDVE